MTSKTRLTLDLKDSQSFDTLILHRGDSNSRIIEIELTDNHAPVTLTSGMSATINASTNGIVVADGEKATVDTANNIISFIVTDNMTSLPGQSKISITVTEGESVITAQTFRAIVTDAVINEGSKFEPTGGTVKQFMDELASARGDYDNLGIALNSKADKATTLEGYGITDGCTKDTFDAEMQKIMKNVSKNVIALTSGTYSKNGITVDVNSDNHISISGTASAYAAIDIPVKCSIESGVTYALSTQNSNATGTNDSTVTLKLRGNNVDIAMLTINYYGLTKNVTFAASVNADTLRISIATGKTINVECDVQLEKGKEYTEFISPNSEKNYLLKLPLSDGSVSEKNLDYELQNKTSKIPNMTYLYVSNDYTSSDEGFGVIKFNSIIDANESITDNDEFNRYTIVVKSGTYNEFETRYTGSEATALEGIITKDYVYYESENTNNPSECVLTWDGAYGYEAGTLTNDMAVKKCIFHVVGGDYHERGMHTHIKGFTIKSKNTRYGLHKESGGYGRNVDWLIENCIIEYGGRPDVVNGSLTPVVGMGMSPFEVGKINQCDIKYSDGVNGTRALNCHDNAETSLYKNTPAVIIGAKLNIKDCNFNNKIVGLSVKGEATSDTDYVARLENNASISDVENTGWKVYCDTEVI